MIDLLIDRFVACLISSCLIRLLGDYTDLCQIHLMELYGAQWEDAAYIGGLVMKALRNRGVVCVPGRDTEPFRGLQLLEAYLLLWIYVGMCVGMQGSLTLANMSPNSCRSAPCVKAAV